MANERKRLSLPIVGINRSEPDHSVTDGSCTHLVNLRHTEGAWRNTAPCKKLISANASGGNGNAIVYKHPASPEQNYIAQSGNSIREVKFTPESGTGNYRLEVTQELLAVASGSTAKISHFGSVLIIRVEPDKKIYYFFYQGGKYQLFSVPTSPVVTDISTDDDNCAVNLTPDYCRIYASDILQWWYPYTSAEAEGRSMTDVCYNLFNLSSGETVAMANDGLNTFWAGEIALFAVYRMKDGTTLSPSMLTMFDSKSIDRHSGETFVSYTTNVQVGCYANEKTDEKPVYVLIRQSAGIYESSIKRWPSLSDIPSCLNYQRIKPIIEIAINDSDINTDLIDRVTIYATRVKPPFDYAALQNGKLSEYVQQVKDMVENIVAPNGNAFITIGYDQVWDDNQNLFTEPFYRLKDIDISDFTNGKYELTLSYDILRNIEHNPVYEPNQSLNHVYGDVYFEYNNRVHLGNIHTELFKGYPVEQILHCTSGYGGNTSIVVSLQSEYEIKYLTNTALNVSSYRYINGKVRVLSFPDYRAKQAKVYVSNNQDPAGGGTVRDVRDYSPNGAANFAFSILPAQDSTDYNRRNKYPVFDSVNLYPEYEPYDILPDDNILDEPGRIQVSGLNNPLSLPFELSYSVGEIGNRIIALNAISDQLSDAKFGEYPLMAFTSQGIFAIQNGSGDVVYSSIIQINRDIINGPNTLAARHFVFYGTSRGLMAIQGRESVLISEPIHQIEDNVVKTPDGNAILNFQHRNNELIVQWDYTTFCYSLTHKYWYFRDGLTRGSGNRIINNNQIVDYSCNVYDLETEEMDGDPVYFIIATRPIKFGSVEFKRIESFIIRMQSAEKFTTSFTLEGSNDKVNWVPLRTEQLVANNDVTLRRTPLSFKFFRFVIFGSTSQYITLNDFDIEFYHKCLHRMR